MTDEATWLCLRCGGEFPEGDYSACPGCGGTGVPANITTDTVTPTITWHELPVTGTDDLSMHWCWSRELVNHG